VTHLPEGWATVVVMNRKEETVKSNKGDVFLVVQCTDLQGTMVNLVAGKKCVAALSEEPVASVFVVLQPGVLKPNDVCFNKSGTSLEALKL
jgi:hypothetical protein